MEGPLTAVQSSSASRVEVVSELGAPAEEVWAAATDLAQINDELKPLMRMTAPRGWKSISAEQVQPGQRLFRSWLLLAGVLPVDFDDLTIAEIGPGHRVQEASTMISASVWEHERVLRRVGPRLFAHRHRRLRRRYGDAGSSTGGT